MGAVIKERTKYRGNVQARQEAGSYSNNLHDLREISNEVFVWIRSETELFERSEFSVSCEDIESELADLAN